MNLDILRIMNKVLRRQFENVVKQLRRVTRFLSRPYQAINKFVRDMLKTVFLPPAAKCDYFCMGERFIAKKLVYLGAALIAVAIFLVGNYFLPWAEGRWWAPTVVLNSAKYHGFNGQAKVVNAEGRLIYTGALAAGRVTGQGTQYDLEGKLLYSGTFLNEEYEGEGRYYRDDLLYYEGSFRRNQFSGDGTLFSPTGIAIYRGQFDQNQPSGQGTAFDAQSGVRVYEGQFAKGLYEGQGYHFALDGATLLYEGGFISGVYSGQGRKYDAASLIYEGGFANGLYEGQGKQYDAKTGRLLYEGGFAAGQRQGEGKLYDLNRGACVFDGHFFADEIDYSSYLSLDYQDLRQSFLNETYIDYGETGFVLYYHSLSLALVCDYADANRDTTKLRRILLAGERGLAGTQIGNTRQDIELRLGPSFTQIGFTPDEGQAQALRRLGKQTDADGLDSDKYITDNYYCRYYYDAQGRVTVMEIGGAE